MIGDCSPVLDRNRMLPMACKRKRTRSLACMRLDKVVGSGTFGVVYKAVDKTTPEETVVALKKIKMERETQGFPVTAIREIRILNTMRHENIVRLLEVITYNDKDDESEPSLIGQADLAIGDVFMVFEFVDFDLAGLLKSQKFRLTPALIKSYAFQLLQGVNYLHENRILHRDIKSANLLITRGNVLKIADWGLARTVPSSAHRLTVPVVTLWYRSPELILGAKQYSTEVDMWSVGCIFGEMHTKVAMFPGDREATQLELIFSLLGSPAGALLDKYKELGDWDKLTPNKTLLPRLSTKMSQFMDNSGHGLSLLTHLLDLSPATRWTAAQALRHEYFTSAPLPAQPAELPAIKIEAVTEWLEQERSKQDRLASAQLQAQQAQLLQGQAVAKPAGVPAAGTSGVSMSLTANKAKLMRDRDRADNPKLKKFGVVRPGAAAAVTGTASSAAPVAAPAPAAVAPVAVKEEHEQQPAKKPRP